MKVLFWNTHNNANINDFLVEIITENNISFVALAEYGADIKSLITSLSFYGIEMREYINCSNSIKLLGTIENVEPRFDSEHATIQIVNNKDILCCIHLNSQIFSGHEDKREIFIEGIVHEIQLIEKDLDTENTIIVGDFNINPYDTSCINARYFHGMPIYEIAKRKSRIVSGKEFSMFYNPMWSFLGDFNKPYGTYYYGGNDAVNTYWNLYDQVIIRPALKDRFVDESLKILTETETRYLLNSNGHPDKNISDHLPITFEIKEN